LDLLADERVHRQRRVTDRLDLLEAQFGEGPLRGVKWSQVAVPRIGPLTNLHPPRASGGNMYLQRAHLTSGVGAGR
jgi:hypothetical protein